MSTSRLKERRKALVDRLKMTPEPQRAADLAAAFGVSRQVIVQDVALLRAQGHPILATPMGYIWAAPAAPSPQAPQLQRVFAVRHGPEPETIEAELMAVVNLGAVVVDVIVEHAVYGELKGLLMVRTRTDVLNFLQRLQTEQAEPLLVLTQGVHLHTIAAPSAAVLDQVHQAFASLGFLLSSECSHSC